MVENFHGFKISCIRNMHNIAQGMPRARRAGGASAACNGHKGRVGGVSAASGRGWHGAGGRGRGG